MIGKMLKLISFLCILSISVVNVQCQGYGRDAATNPAKVKPGRPGGPKDGPMPPSTPFPYALSSTYLTFLAKVEAEVFKEVKEYAKEMKERLRLAQIYLNDYEDSTVKGLSHLPEDTDIWHKAAQAASHPLIAYRMVRRFSEDFQNFVVHINKYLESKMEERLKTSGLYNWPADKDHEDAMDAILRLHYVYNMDIKQFTSGNIAGVPTAVGLTAAQTFKFAEYAVSNEYYTLAMDWLKVTESRIKEENDTSVSPFQVANTYKNNIDRHDKDFEKNDYLQHLYIFDGKVQGAQNATRLRDLKIKEYTSDIKSTAPEAGHYKFLDLCNGKNFQTEKVKSKLTCWLETSRHAYFAINPLKMELLSKEPFLMQIYDVIGDKWIKDLRKTAMPTLQRAPPPTGPGVTPRTATYAWLEDGHIPDTPLSRRIELITDLNVRGMVASEALQIASYAFGGHVSTHFDSLGGNPNDPVVALKGDRVSTFLIYLNEVQKGGLTAFPIIGAHVKPVKGSAVFWYTALKNGTIDQRMLHGACPVILGHKWIATKWTHLNENMWKRPCALDSWK